MDTDSQAAALLAHLKAGKAITQLEALSIIGSLRLGARIWDLRQLGHDIRTDMIEVGDKKRVARYYLVPPAPRPSFAIESNGQLSMLGAG